MTAYRPPSRKRTGTGFATGAAAALVVAVIIVVTLVELARSGSVKSHLGASTLNVGRADDLAVQVAETGPLLLPDLTGSTRPIWLQHLGGDPKLGWVGIQALNPGEKRTCVLAWQQADRTFRDPCTGVTYPADGAGLVRYPVTVLPSKRISLDLRTPLQQGATVTTGTAPPAG